LRSFQGGIEYAHYQGIISPAYTILEPQKEVVHKYYRYLLKSKHYISGLTLLVTGIREGQNIDTGKFKDSFLPLPTKDEQIKIATFLDYKLSKIDRFIRKKKQLIILLNEQKAAIINQAVTKGLDPNAKMKPSGIEWLGDIPEHWEVWRLKYLIIGRLKYGANEPGGDFKENDPRYIRITDFDKSGKLKDDTFCSLNSKLAEPYLLKEGDILFARSGGTVGKTFQFKNYNGKACYAGYLIKAEPNNQLIKSDYLFEYTNSGVYDTWKSFIFNKATIENIGADKYSQLPVILPTLKEQIGIVNFIKSETKVIDRTISTIEKELSLVEEYKTALIAEAVTGKIDVRDYEIPEIVEEESYEELEEELSLGGEGEVTINDENEID
jgi:restriction endonuclease S subunit